MLLRRLPSKSTSSLLAALLSIAAAGPVVSPPVLTGYFDVAFTYDDNLFRYSAADLEAFRLGSEPKRFPIRTSDDLDVVIGVGCTYRFGTAGRRGLATLRTRMHQYVSNWEKSYGLLEVGVGQRITRLATARASFLWMPGYLVRYYRNPASGVGDYVACRYTEYLANAKVELKLGCFEVVPSYRHEWDDYLPAFDCYDTRAHRFGGSAGFQASHQLRFQAEYERKLARARGSKPDISYNQHELGLVLAVRPERTRFDFEASYNVELRTYTAGPADPAHAGREDDIENVAVGAGYRLGRTRINLRYEFEWRNVWSPDSEKIEDVRQYRQNRLTFGVRMNPTDLFSGG